MQNSFLFYTNSNSKCFGYDTEHIKPINIYIYIFFFFSATFLLLLLLLLFQLIRATTTNNSNFGRHPFVETDSVKTDSVLLGNSHALLQAIFD